MTSAFLAASLRSLRADRPDVLAVVTYADLDQGHRGTVYQATNALFTGTVATGESYCRVHLDSAKRFGEPSAQGPRKNCGAIQKNGQTCRAITTDLSGLCGLHRNQAARIKTLKPEPVPVPPKSPRPDRAPYDGQCEGTNSKGVDAS